MSNNKKHVNKAKPTKSNKTFRGMKRFTIPSVILIAVVVIIAVVTSISKNKSPVPPKDYFYATETLKEHINGKLPPDWFEITDINSIIPKDSRIYIDIDSNKLFFINGNHTQSVSYKTVNNNHDIVKVEDADIEILKSIMRDMFGIDEIINEVKAIANQIAAPDAYVEKIKLAKLSRENNFLSLIYNAVVGDEKGHVSVTIENKKIKFIRHNDIPHGYVDVDKFCQMATRVQSDPASFSDSVVLTMLIASGAIDTGWCPPAAYYDLRNDCIRVGTNVVAQLSVDGEQFNVLARQIKERPEVVFLYVNGKLTPLSDSLIENPQKLYGKFNSVALSGIKFKHSSLKATWPTWLVVTALLIGVVIGICLWCWMNKIYKRKNADKHNDNKEPDGKENIVQVGDESVETIRTMLSEQPTILDRFNKIVEDSAKVEKARTILSEYKARIADLEEKNEKMRSYINSAKDKAKSVELILGKKTFSLLELIEAVSKDWNRTEGSVKKALADYNKEVENNLRESKEFKSIASKATVFDKVVTCGKESNLLELLEELRAKYPKMTHIRTLADVQGDNKDDNQEALLAVIKNFDQATDRKLLDVVSKMKQKSDWFDANYKTVVSPALAFRKAAPSWRNNPQEVVSHAIYDLIAPLMGTEWEASLTDTVDAVNRAFARAKAFDTVAETRQSKPDTSTLMNNLGNFGLDRSEVEWIGSLYEAARLYSSSSKFAKNMYELFVREFVNREPRLDNPDSTEDRAWFYAMLLNITYHTVDHVRGQINPSDEKVGCFNKRFMDSGFDKNAEYVDEYEKGNAIRSTRHADTIVTWAEEQGVEHLKILIDKYFVKP